MITTPNSNRKHISIFGKTNSGKSTLMNLITDQDISIVSDRAGTTTDPVSKAMELLPYGPVLFTDTAGIYDSTELGELRIKKTMDVLKRTDLGIYVVDSTEFSKEEIDNFNLEFKKYNVPYILVLNKVDLLNSEEIKELTNKFTEVICISSKDRFGLDLLRERIIELLEHGEEEIPIVGELLSYGSKVILVVPIDSEAPKGRLILPQVQCIRDCLDHGIKSYVVRDTELEAALEDIKDVDLVITDSQAFKKVDKIVPKNIKLTSFSMLFARQKGDIQEFLNGVEVIRNIKPNDKVLITETCAHNTSHEDIGKVKIPNMLQKYVKGSLNFTFATGRDFPEELNEYKLVIHCGGCMVNRKTMLNRINLCKENNVPITNYGVALSFLTDTLERSSTLFLEKTQ